MQKKTNKQEIFGICVDSTELVEVLKAINSKKSLFLVSINPEYIVAAQQDKEFRDILNSADLRIPDGFGLRFMIPDLPIIPGRKLVETLATAKYKIFYLGGKNDNNEQNFDI